MCWLVFHGVFRQHSMSPIFRVQSYEKNCGLQIFMPKGIVLFPNLTQIRNEQVRVRGRKCEGYVRENESLSHAEFPLCIGLSALLCEYVRDILHSLFLLETRLNGKYCSVPCEL